MSQTKGIAAKNNLTLAEVMAEVAELEALLDRSFSDSAPPRETQQ